MAETTYYDSPLTGAELDEAFRNLGALQQSVADAAQSAETAARWAEQAQHSANGALGWYDTPEALQAAYPRAEAGQWALVGSTASLWLWDPAAEAFVDAAARLYTATFLLEGWQGEGPYTQTAALTPADGGPAVTAQSLFAGPPLCRRTESESTNRTLLKALGLFNAGDAVLGNGTVTAELKQKPAADMEVWWSVRKGE